MPAFDILATLAPIAAALVVAVGGGITAGLGVWAIGVGADVAIKKFGKNAKRG